MARYKKKALVSEETKAEALAVAKGTQRPGQSKDQTRLIAQGVQKGIDIYKKQQNAKARELDRRLKKVSAQTGQVQVETQEVVHIQQAKLPWVLLILTWLGILIYVIWKFSS